MSNKKILSVIGQVNDEYIEEAIPYSKTVKRHHYLQWGALVACLALAVFIAIKIIPTNPVEPTPGIGDLPMLAISENSGEAMGFEGYTAYDISEIVNNNPWRETSEISTLPVYQNLLAYDENYQVSEADFDKMKEFLLNVASRLGMDVDNLEITDNAPDEKTQDAIREKLAEGESVPDGYFSPSAIIIKGDGIEVEVDQQMIAKITFEPTIPLPDEYNFTHYATYEQVSAVAKYLREKYKDLIGMDNPQVNIHGGDYSIFSGEYIEIYGAKQAQGYNIEFYDSGDDISQIINYNFNRVAFYCDDDGKLFLARVFQPDLSSEVGDYPIITSDKAKELLKNGNYITTVPEKLPGLDYVAKVELVYRTGGTEQYFMPYYRFYVELPDMERENGLKTYGAYYVPAVEGEYISNMPVWDGSFN